MISLITDGKERAAKITRRPKHKIKKINRFREDQMVRGGYTQMSTASRVQKIKIPASRKNNNKEERARVKKKVTNSAHLANTKCNYIEFKGK